MFKQFSYALWLEVQFRLSGRLDKGQWMQTLTIVMVDGEPDHFHQSIPLTAILPGLL